MKKKLLSMVVAVGMIASMMSGCGSKTETATSETVAVTQTAESSTVEATEETQSATEETTEAETTESTETTPVNVAVLKGPTAMGMVKLMDESDNGETGSNQYQFTIAAAADEITPQLVQGNLDIAAVPANLAAVLYNNDKVDVNVLAINTLGVLYIVENGDSIQSVADLEGKTIYASGKGSTPEYALNYMLQANGIDPEKDVTIEYKSEHSECVAALSSQDNAIAMLPQPFVTVAQTSNDKIRIALDLTQEWEKASSTTETPATLITGVVIARSAFIEEHPEAVAEFLDQYEDSVTFVNENTADAAQLIGGYDIVKAPVAEIALPYCNITFIAGEEMQQKLSSYLTILFGQNPESVGGEVPDESFYYIQK